MSDEPKPRPGEWWICAMEEDRAHYGSARQIPQAARFVALYLDHGAPQWHKVAADPMPPAWVAPIDRVDLGAAPAAPPKPRTVLRRLGPLEIEITRPAAEGEASKMLRFTGAAALRVATWHAHMATHGEAWAATYLAGVVDGLRLHHASDMAQIMERLQRHAASLPLRSEIGED